MPRILSPREFVESKALPEDGRIVRADCLEDFKNCSSLRRTVLNYKGMVYHYPMSDAALYSAKLYVKKYVSKEESAFWNEEQLSRTRAIGEPLKQVLRVLRESFIEASGSDARVIVGLRVNSTFGQKPHIHKEALTYRIFGGGTKVYDVPETDGGETPILTYEQAEQEILYAEGGLPHGAPELTVNRGLNRFTAFALRSV